MAKIQRTPKLSLRHYSFLENGNQKNGLIFLGDCGEQLKKIPDNSIDLIITDPPYMTTNEEWDQKEVFGTIILTHLHRVAKPSCSLYVWCGIGERSQSLIRWFSMIEEFFHFKDLITWKKQRGIGMRKGWLYTREEILWFVKDNSQFIWNKSEQYDVTDKRAFSTGKNTSDYKRWTNVWVDIQEINQSIAKNAEKAVHPAQKPLKALERIIRLHTQENDVVLDCFMGSGNVGIACKKLGRKFIGMELDPGYFQMAKERIKNA